MPRRTMIPRGGERVSVQVERLVDVQGQTIFERATLIGETARTASSSDAVIGGNILSRWVSSNNILVLGDHDGVIHIDGREDLLNLQTWTGEVTFDNKGNQGDRADTLNEYYVINLAGTGGTINVSDSGGSQGFDELYVYGSRGDDDIRLDRGVGDLTAGQIRVIGTGEDLLLHQGVNRVTINTLTGNDSVLSDDTAVQTVINMGAWHRQTRGRNSALDPGSEESHDRIPRWCADRGPSEHVQRQLRGNVRLWR